MSRPQPVPARLITLFAAAVLFTGCSGTATSPTTSASPTTSTSTRAGAGASTQASTSPVCAAADAFTSALTNFKDMVKPDTTLEQLGAARDQVEKTFDDLIQASGNAAKERVDAVVAAEKEFVSAVNAASDQASVRQAVESLRKEAANVQAAVSDLMADAKC